jgi:hypothetical protein
MRRRDQRFGLPGVTGPLGGAFTTAPDSGADPRGVRNGGGGWQANGRLCVTPVTQLTRP